MVTQSADLEARTHMPARSATGELESAVMEILWDRDAWTSGSDVHAALQDTHPVAYTTALTVLVRMCDKELVQRKRFTGRAYHFRATHSRAETAAARIHDVLADTSDRPAVLTQLIEHLDVTDRERLRALLDATTGDD
jgi:predicted transcriptional regulator